MNVMGDGSGSKHKAVHSIAEARFQLLFRAGLYFLRYANDLLGP